MSQEILLELDDLLQAERELTGLLAALRSDEQEARVMYARLQDWKGQSANVLRDQIEVFFMEMSRRIREIEEQKRPRPVCAIYETSRWRILTFPCLSWMIGWLHIVTGITKRLRLRGRSLFDIMKIQLSL